MGNHHDGMPTVWLLCRVVVVCCLVALVSSCGGNGDKSGVSLIINTQTNPYFVSMKQAAQKAAVESGAHLSVASGQATATRSRRSTRSTPRSLAATRAS